MYPTQLDLDPDQTLFAQTCRQFLEKEYPLSTVRERMDTAAEFDPDLWKREAELGWFGLLSPVTVGGGGIAGNGVADSAIVAGELGRFLHPGAIGLTNVIAAALARRGTPEQRATLVPQLIDGQAVATWALGDPGWIWGQGRCAVAVQTQDGDVVIDGNTGYVQEALGADYLLVSGRRAGGPDDGSTVQVLVPAGAAGVRISPLRSLDLTRGLADVAFDSVRLPASAVLGSGADARDDVVGQFDLAVLLQTAETVGAADRVYEFTLQYAKDRIAFGRPIGSYQAIKHRLADLLVWLESCKATLGAAIRATEDDSDERSHLVSVAASYVGDTGPRLIQECVQIHGGIGLTWEHDIHLYLRRAATNAALLGNPAAHRRRLDTLLAAIP